MLFRYRRYLWKHRRELFFWRLRRRAVKESVAGGRGPWEFVGLAIYGVRLIRKVLNPGPEVVATERLEPGQSVSIRAIDPRTEPGG